MFSILLFIGLLAGIATAWLAIRKRQLRWLLATLLFVLIPLGSWAPIALACHFGSGCP
jgi:hypothetical protein